MNRTVPKIVLIDDEPDILGIMRTIFQKNGYEAVTFQDPPSMETLAQEDPDIVFLDLLLKGQHGVDVCKRIRDHETLQDLPVVIVSAHTREEVAQACTESGANDFITKPFSMKVLLEKAENYRLRRDESRRSSNLHHE